MALVSSPPLIGDFITFILTGDLATGGFNRSTVVAVQDAVRVLPKVVFFPHYNTTVITCTFGAIIQFLQGRRLEKSLCAWIGLLSQI